MSDETLHAIQIELTKVTGELTTLNRNVERIDGLLSGDGSDEKPGIVTQVRLLKQSSENRTWRERGYFTGLIALVVKAVWDLVPGVR